MSTIWRRLLINAVSSWVSSSLSSLTSGRIAWAKCASTSASIWVSLRQPSRRFGKVPRLTRIDHRYGQAGHAQLGYD